MRPPKPPKAFYKDFWHYLLGIASPSLVLKASGPEVDTYHKRYRAYTLWVLQEKVNTRTASREEYKCFIRLIKNGV